MRKTLTATTVALCVSLSSMTSSIALAESAEANSSKTTSSDSWTLTEQDMEILRYGVTSKADAAKCVEIANSPGPRPDVAGWPFCSKVEITEAQYQAALRKEHHPMAISSHIGRTLESLFFSS